MNTFQIRIATPERVVFEGPAESLTLPTTSGEITVLAHHMPLSTVLRPGEMLIRNGSEVVPFAVSGGFVEVQPERVIVLADTAERESEIDEQRSEEARRRAEELRQKLSADHTDYANLSAKIEKELARTRVARKYRHRGHVGITQESVRPESAIDE